MNSESAWWPLNSPPAKGTAFNVCLRHYTTGTFNATLRIYQGPVLAFNSWTVFTTPASQLSQFGKRHGLVEHPHGHMCGFLTSECYLHMPQSMSLHAAHARTCKSALFCRRIRRLRPGCGWLSGHLHVWPQPTGTNSASSSQAAITPAPLPAAHAASVPTIASCRTYYGGSVLGLHR